MPAGAAAVVRLARDIARRMLDPADRFPFNHNAYLRAYARSQLLWDYDVVLVGAGIYSLPLVAHAKQRGKKGIHLGGSTQLFFGIRGSRWDSMKEFQGFFNEFWVRPAVEERPANFQMVERGCYW